MIITYFVISRTVFSQFHERLLRTYQETVRFVARLILIKGAFYMQGKVSRKFKQETILSLIVSM
jgi:uncharacterized membrane protein